ncbi:MAG: PulJ/GspJ family protein [Thermaceae bacterium]
MGKKGFTLLEVVVALFLLGVLMGAAYSAIVSFTRDRAQLDARASAQAKLRRIVEVLTQDLRSMALGGLASDPYPTGERSISFVLLEGGGGYPVLPHNAGGQSFEEENMVELLAPDGLDINPGDTVLLVNASGQAVLLPVTGVRAAWNSRFYVDHAGCRNTISYTPNTLLFRVRKLGLRYTPEDQTLYAHLGMGEVPMAFNLKSFRLDYVYVAPGGGVLVNPPGYDYSNPTGSPPGTVQQGGVDYSLKRLSVTLSTEVRGVSRSYTAQVDLLEGTPYGVRSIRPCR